MINFKNNDIKHEKNNPKHKEKNNLKYKAVIFDFDYTLADSSRGVYESVYYALNKMGYSCPGYEEVCKTIGLHLSQTFAVLTGNENNDDATKFRDYFKERADQVMAEKTIIFNEVRPAFEYFVLKRIKCAIVSTKFRYRIKEFEEYEPLYIIENLGEMIGFFG